MVKGLEDFTIEELVNELHNRHHVIMFSGNMKHTSGAYIVEPPKDTVILIIKQGNWWKRGRY